MPPTRERFADAYEGTPPWDVGHPQPDLCEALDRLDVAPGLALDLGCGTGELVLELARRGWQAWGLDATLPAIELARAKARERGVDATFVHGDALDLKPLGQRYDLICDCGLFHVIDDAEREAYVAQVRATLKPGGFHLMMGFQPHELEFGPRGYSPEALRGFFAEGFTERGLWPGVFATTGEPERPPAWVSLFQLR